MQNPIYLLRDIQTKVTGSRFLKGTVFNSYQVLDGGLIIIPSKNSPSLAYGPFRLGKDVKEIEWIQVRPKRRASSGKKK